MPSPVQESLNVVTSWQVGIAVNVIVSVAFFTIAGLILVPLIRSGHLRTNKVAVSAGLVFVAVGISRLVRIVRLAEPLFGGDDSALARHIVTAAACLDLVTACAAVTYLVLRITQRSGLAGSPLFDDRVHRERVTNMAVARAEQAARAVAQADRDSYTAMLNSIIQNSQSAIYVKDLDGRYLMANRRLLEIMGGSEADVLGRTDQTVGADTSPFVAENDIRAQAGFYRLEEWTDAFPDGRHFYDSVKFPLHDKEGSLYATCGVSLDVTAQRRAIGAAADARDDAVVSAAAKATFLATMSHEIRTPMNAVIGMTDLLMDTDLDVQQYEFLETVRTSGEALLSVINDILDFSKIEAGEMELESAAFNLRDEIESCLDLVVVATTAKRLELICHVDDSCPEWVVGDVVRLRQIIANLLANAVKFTQEGEVLVVVSCSPTPDDRLKVSVSVTDTGIGVSTLGLDRLFGSFSQVDASTTRVYGGTGLGLAISQRLAEAMQGRVEVTSTLGVGSTFLVTVVLDRSPEAALPEAQDPPRSSLAGRSVLLVDDNVTNLRILNMQLTALGMTCTTAASPESALALVAGGLSYDVAVLDMVMPGMDGVQLGAALAHLDSQSAPQILLTSMGWRPGNLEQSFAAYLTKPVKRASLQDALISAMAGQRHGPKSSHSRTAISEQMPPPLRILLAEDNPVNQRVAQLILGKLGQRADIVGNGTDAVRAVQQTGYDVVLMDVQMPQMDGLEATRRIRVKKSQHQPYIVAMTAGALLEDREACTDAGMDGYLAKPVRARELRDLLMQVGESIEAQTDAATTEQGEVPIMSGSLAVGEASVSDAPSGGGSTSVEDRIEEVQDRIEQVQDRIEQAEDRNEADGGPAVARPVGGESQEPVATPAIDVEVFDELMSELDEGDGNLRDDLIGSYLADGEIQVGRLLQAVRTGDRTTAGVCAHTLRSTSALVGAATLAELLQQTEDFARVSPADPIGMAAVAVRVEAEYARVSRSLLLLAAASSDVSAMVDVQS